MVAGMMSKNYENLMVRLTTAGRKLTAIAFILLILIANFWLIKRFTGEANPQWTEWIFFLGASAALVGFLLMVPGWLNPQLTNDNSGDDLESDKSER
jgi:purine-cytosine permease-like protein